MKSSPLSLCILTMIVISSTAATRSRAADFPAIRFPAGQTSVVVPLRTGGDEYLVPVQINGKDAGWFLIDTGCQVTTVDPKVAADLKLPPVVDGFIAGVVGKKKAAICAVNSLSIGGVTIEPLIVAVFPEGTDWGAGEFTAPHLSGVLGTNVLRRLPFTLNFPAATLTLYEPGKFRAPAGAKRFELRIVEDMPLVRVDIEQHFSDWFLFDTGGNGSLVFGHSFARTHPELVNDRPWQHTFASSLGVRRAHRMVLDRVQWLGQDARAVEAEYFDSITEVEPPQDPALAVGDSNDNSAGMLGAWLMRGLSVTLSCRTGELFVEKLPSAHPTAWDRPDFNPSTPDAIGDTPLMRAVALGESEYVKRFLAAKVDVNAHANDSTSITALSLAANSGPASMVRMLVKAGATVDPPSVERVTPLIAAARQADPAVVAALLDAGAKIDAQDEFGLTALIEAAEFGNTETARVLLRAKADVTIESKPIGTALHAAAGHGNAELVKLLIEHGADVNHRTKRLLLSPLFCAAQSGSVEAVRLLLAHGARIDDANIAGTTALCHAALGGQLEVVELLLKEGADPKMTDRNGYNALNYAEMMNRVDVATRLYFSIHPPATQPR